MFNNNSRSIGRHIADQYFPNQIVQMYNWEMLVQFVNEHCDDDDHMLNVGLSFLVFLPATSRFIKFLSLLSSLEVYTQNI